jgi:hypothetical protein
MLSNKIKFGEYYRLKSTPNYSYVTPLKILKPNSKENENPFIVVVCEHVVSKGDTIGFIRKFRLSEIIEDKK